MNSISALEQFMSGLIRRNPGETEFHQAVHEVFSDIFPYIEDKPKYQQAQILERMSEPDRIITFRVTWEDDIGNVRVNRGWRVQNNNAIGPYKGGLRFHPSVNQSILKFLAFEQTFKNSLTGLPMGGAKGGANFNPKGKSEKEIMRFCQAFMTELKHYIGENTDIPAGDMGVGAREIGFLFGQYKRLTKEFTGTVTGKGMEYGGSLIRMEATGYGTVYFAEHMLNTRNETLEGKSVCISGSGNVALHAAEKVIQLGGKVITLSDSSGFIHDKKGLTLAKLTYIKKLKVVDRARISSYLDEYPQAEFHPDQNPWSIPCKIALPCATQNEINAGDAQTLLSNGCVVVSEGANMPSTLEAVNLFQGARILYAPSKAANAGGVAVSGLEMSQNSGHISWKEEELQHRLHDIMSKIHKECEQYGRLDDNYVDYVKGANIAGFIKVANAMLAYGSI
jgi:glutamate dehydrogenase (NADP+)